MSDSLCCGTVHLTLTHTDQGTQGARHVAEVRLTDSSSHNRALSSTYSSLPTPSQLIGVFHSTTQGSENVPLWFRCLESCLTALCSWETRASTSQVTSLLLGGHTVKLSAALGRRERTESIAHHHHVAILSRMFLGYNFVATLRNTATRSRCSTRRAINEVSALLTNVKYSSRGARTSLKLTASSTVGPGKDQRVGYHVFVPVELGAFLNHCLLQGSLASTLRVLRSALWVALQCVSTRRCAA